MSESKIVFCDTGFMIRLLDKTSELHDNALGYFRYFLENDYEIRMSTIAVAEFCVKGSIEHLPLKNILLAPFNAFHASKTGEAARVLFDAKSRGVVEVESRVIIQNDVKLLVQAQCEHADFYLTSDSKSVRMYNVLREDGKVSFDFTDIHIPCNSKFGIIDFGGK